jgi:hypothetical protein
MRMMLMLMKSWRERRGMGMGMMGRRYRLWRRGLRVYVLLEE